MGAEPVFIQIETEAWSFRNRKHALAHGRFRTLRHFFFVAPESAEGVLHFEKVLRRGSDVHGRIESDQRTRPAVHSHRRTCEGGVIGDSPASRNSARV